MTELSKSLLDLPENPLPQKTAIGWWTFTLLSTAAFFSATLPTSCTLVDPSVTIQEVLFMLPLILAETKSKFTVYRAAFEEIDKLRAWSLGVLIPLGILCCVSATVEHSVDLDAERIKILGQLVLNLSLGPSFLFVVPVNTVVALGGFAALFEEVKNMRQMSSCNWRSYVHVVSILFLFLFFSYADYTLLKTTTNDFINKERASSDLAALDIITNAGFVLIHLYKFPSSVTRFISLMCHKPLRTIYSILAPSGSVVLNTLLNKRALMKKPIWFSIVVALINDGLPALNESIEITENPPPPHDALQPSQVELQVAKP